MAELQLYKCPKCGYEVQANQLGHDTFMDGEYYDFWCHNCDEIVSINVFDMAKQGMSLICPECNKADMLSNWNPVEGHCPKCNSHLIATGEYIMAD
ncbi:MAG: hypothetical protein HDQ88_01830 [Clostridia bacterium]|nr:hypothetical protein [Clostridia bacterium]